MAQPLLNADQVADRLAASVDTVYEWVRTGKLPAVRIGRTVRFSPEAIDQFIAQGGTPQGHSNVAQAA